MIMLYDEIRSFVLRVLRSVLLVKDQRMVY